MRRRIFLGVTLIVSLVILAAVLLHGTNIAVLNPHGTIATQQRNLLVFTFFLSLVVIVPVFILLFVISWKYREGNKKATYRPDWDGSRLLETIWWGIPIVIILILGVVTWRTSHELDPYRALDATAKPITIEVVALQWKWLFIYPEQHIATVNYIQIPEKTPITFKITSDAPMNSFWIPSLGGQVYAMTGMSTELHLMADATGTYNGSSANISGEGFSKMRFVVRSTRATDFTTWVARTQSSHNDLNMDTYTNLMKPSILTQPTYYSLSDTSLYDKIVMKYMAHGSGDGSVHQAPLPQSMPAMKGM